MIAHNPSRHMTDAALAVLRGRERMPADPAEFGRQWGFAPGVSARLVRRVERERRTKPSPATGAKHP